MALMLAVLLTGPAGAKPPLLEFKSYDLGRIVWYASAELPPDSSIDVIREKGTATTPTVTLRSAVHGGAGMLFCFVQLPDPLPPGCTGRLTIGDIDGVDEAFCNGKLIGSTRDWTLAEVRPRMYLVPGDVLRPGVNIFCLRLSGAGGKPTFGIRSKTLTFNLTQTPEPGEAPPEAGRGPDAVSTVDEGQARAAILAYDPAVSTSLLQRKRVSFGRFGEFEHNGLPAVSEVSPTRVASRHAPAFEVALDHVDDLQVARGEGEPGIDGWHRLTQVKATARGVPVSYRVRQSVLYPGAVLQLDRGKVLELRVRFPQGRGKVFPLSSEELQKVFGGLRPPADLSVYGFLPEGDQASPAIVAVSGLAVNVTQAPSQIDVSLARKSEETDARVYVFYPLGLYRLTGGKDWDGLLDLAQAARPEQDPVEAVRQWLRVGLHEPVGVDEYFTPINGDAAVRVFQTTRYRPATGVHLGGPVLMRPPQVDFAKEMLGYAVAGPETSSTGILSFTGDIYYADAAGATTASQVQGMGGLQHVYVTSYDLPVPPLRERAAVHMYGQEPMVGLLNECALQDLGSSLSVTAVDALYKSRAAAYAATSYLTPARRQELAQNSAATVMAALGGHFWHSAREPASGLEYWYTSSLQGPYYKKYDQDWGNGLALYGLFTYVKFSGDWQLPEKHWDVVERIFRWFTVTDDWEWMRASNSAHGYGTGAGDCQNATYAAAVAYTKMARETQRQAEYHYGLYTVARAAVSSLTRFAYGDFGVANQFKSANSVVVGFHEGEGFLEGELDGYPWNATSNISGYGVQSENFDLLLSSAPDAVRNFEQIFEKNFPHWLNGEHNYGSKTLYQGNSGMITLPHIYLRALLGGDSVAMLVDLLTSARTNKAYWWIAPPVIAEVLTRRADGIVVTEWERAVFLGGKVEPTDNDDRRKLTLYLDNGTTGTNRVSVKLPRRPFKFEINGGPVPLTDGQFEDGELKLRLRRPGENVITVIYARK